MKHAIHRVAVFSLLVAGTPLWAADHWPEWRGPAGQGVSDAVDLPVTWDEKHHVAWKTAIPGRGWSTPVVAQGRVWVTTAIDTPAAQSEAERRRKLSTNSEPLTVSDFVSLRAVELDLATGSLLRDIEVLTQHDPQMIHVDNTYATPSPVIEGGRLYCHYGPSGIACLDTSTAQILWTNRSLEVQHENGAGSSPILWRDLLLIHCDGIDQQYIVALDKHSGKVAWKTGRSGEMNSNPQLTKSYATPLLIGFDGRPQAVSPAADWVYGYDPATGKELWRVAYGQLGFSNAARPVAGPDMFYISTGYPKSQLLAFKWSKSSPPTPQLAWHYQKQVPRVSSPLLVGHELYFASDNGVATCLDALTGEEHWARRIGKRFWAPPLYAEGKIYFCDRDGTTVVLAAGKEFHQLSINRLEGSILASPAAVDGSLLIRSDQAVYCLRQTN